MRSVTRRSISISCVGADHVHGVPEPTVVEGAWAQLAHQPVTGRGLPPVGEGKLRARGHHPVERGQRDVGPDRRRGIGAPRPHHLVDRSLRHRGDRARPTPQRRPRRPGDASGRVRRDPTLRDVGRSPRRCPGSAGRRCAVCRSPGPTRSGSSTSCPSASFPTKYGIYRYYHSAPTIASTAGVANALVTRMFGRNFERP